MPPATREESISFGPTFEDGQFSLFCMQSMVKAKKMHGHIIELRSDPIIRPSKFIELFRVHVLWTRNRWIQTNCRTRASFSGPLMFYWCYLLADVSAMGSWPFFCFRKISSWPCVWNYTPGSKQGRLSEKKTAVRQWITVLWPDKCLSEEWMRKLGVCQESHTHKQSLMCSCTHVCMQMPASLHMERQKQNLEPNHFYYLDGTLARVVSQHNITPVKVKDKHPMFATTVQPWEEVEENLSLSQNAVLFLGTALKGLRSSLWQRCGFAVQTTHILRLTPVNWAGSFTQVCLSLESSMLP